MNDKKANFQYSLEMFQTDVSTLQKKLNNEKFELILGIAKGGLILATMLAYKLEINNLKTIQIKAYEENTLQKEVKIINSCGYISPETSVLIVDDISDTGHTLDFVIKHLGLKNYKIVTLVYKPSSKIIPDYYIHTTEKWVNFFWEK